MSLQRIEIIDGEHVDVTQRFIQIQRQREAEARPVPLNEDEQLKVILRDHEAEFCKCGHEIGWGDIAWNNGCTESGTGYSTVEIQCVGCDTEIVHIDSWYPDIEYRDELLHVLKNDWDKHI